MNSMGMVPKVALVSGISIIVALGMTGCGTTNSAETEAIRKTVESFKIDPSVLADDGKIEVSQPKNLDVSGPITVKWGLVNEFSVDMERCRISSDGDSAVATADVTINGSLSVTDGPSQDSWDRAYHMTASVEFHLVKLGDNWLISQLPSLDMRSGANAPTVSLVPGTTGIADPNPVKQWHPLYFKTRVTPSPMTAASANEVLVRVRNLTGTYKAWMQPGLNGNERDYSASVPFVLVPTGPKYGAILAIDATTLGKSSPDQPVGIALKTFTVEVIENK